ncbi:copper amine oxidase-like protein [Paenibacillus sp. BK033]|uniref:stalk domain-containing protein n=1 Tax=Paenibacillus sp. BK033 TaxID=2512133 RepID=UPI0010E29C02|nr:stalk domain-containing protein [Paenibacillus sp. BK033]TCM86450.1 copper amine oxidase-like protein [Paenibacillus sp. BK033]
MRMKRIRDFTIGVMVGALLLSGTMVYASGINVEMVSLKFFFNNSEKIMPADQHSFIYKGRTYVPLRYMSESAGQSVQYDKNNKAVYIGTPKEGTVTYLENMRNLSVNYSSAGYTHVLLGNGETESNLGEKFSHGIIASATDSETYYSVHTYFLDSKYKRLKGLIAPLSLWNYRPGSKDIGTVTIKDGKDNLLFKSGEIPSDLTSPIPIDLDLSEVSLLKVDITVDTITGGKSGGFAIFDARLIQ